MKVYEIFSDDEPNESPKEFVRDRIRAFSEQKQILIQSLHPVMRKAEQNGILTKFGENSPHIEIPFPPALGGHKFLNADQEKLARWFKGQIKVYDRLDSQLEQLKSSLRYYK